MEIIVPPHCKHKFNPGQQSPIQDQHHPRLRRRLPASLSNRGKIKPFRGASIVTNGRDATANPSESKPVVNLATISLNNAESQKKLATESSFNHQDDWPQAPRSLPEESSQAGHKTDFICPVDTTFQVTP
jgi:hypothetical protein